MTSEDVRSEIDKDPFIPLRFHLVSGKTLDVASSAQVFMLQNAVLIFSERGSGRYDQVSLRNVERLEQLETSHER